MNNYEWRETLVEKKVTYTLELDGKFIIVEGVPARVSLETGERFFSPRTVEMLQQIVAQQQKPVRVLKTPVFEFSAFKNPPDFQNQIFKAETLQTQP